MILKKYNEFINESNIHKGNFKVNFSIITDGRFKKGVIPEIIDGDFICNDLDLISLENGPKEVKGDFDCHFNKISSLEGGPKEVGENFNCAYNKLTSLEGGPEKVSINFYCSYNKLTTLEGCPEKIGGNFYYNANQLTSLEGGPKEVGGSFNSNDNINDLKIETYFIKSGLYKNDYWKDLLKFMLDNKINIEDVIGWPEGFLTTDLISSVKGINKFNL